MDINGLFKPLPVPRLQCWAQIIFALPLVASVVGWAEDNSRGQTARGAMGVHGGIDLDKRMADLKALYAPGGPCKEGVPIQDGDPCAVAIGPIMVDLMTGAMAAQSQVILDQMHKDFERLSNDTKKGPN